MIGFVCTNSNGYVQNLTGIPVSSVLLFPRVRPGLVLVLAGPQDRRVFSEAVFIQPAETESKCLTYQVDSCGSVPLVSRLL